MFINDLYNNKKFVAEAELNPGEHEYYYRVRQQSKRDIELEMSPKLWDAVGPAYATYEEAQAALKALQAKYPNARFTYTQHPRISNYGGRPERAFPESVAEGMKADELSNYCEELVAEKGWDAAYKHAKFMAQGGTDPSWGSVLKYLQSMKDGLNEAHDAAAKEIHGNLFHDSIPPGAEKHHVSAVLKAHGLKDTDAKDVIDRVRKMGYTGPRLDKQETDEGRMVKGPGGVPLDRRGNPIVPKAKPLSMRKWIVIHDGSHGEGGKDIIEAPNAETAWELANEYDLNIISINPYRGPAGPTLVAEGTEEDMPVHRIGLTVIDPQHPMVSKRKEEYQKTVRVPGHDREQAITAAINHLRRRGYKVLDHHYIGLLEDQLDELDKKTVASWIKQQPQRIKGDTGLSRTDFKKAKRLVDKSIPSAIAKYKDPGYGKQEPQLDEVSLGDYRKKAALSKATSQMDRFFGRDNPAAVAQADQTIAKREQGMARADARVKPYTAPPVDLEKQQRDLTAKYPNIDELVRKAELNRDPNYEMADGQAYYAGREAEQNYLKLRQIQRVIQGLNESLNRSHLP